MGDYRRIFITGDTHRAFERIQDFCKEYKTVKEDLLIILGDAGINYFGFPTDIAVKEYLEALPITLLCLHGSHEMRPTSVPGYAEKAWCGGNVYVEELYPSLLFAKDGEIYNLNGFSCVTLGGAYSVDKESGIARGHGRWADEQPSAESKQRAEENLERADWNVDYVFSHTVSIQYEPVETFLSFVDQTKVDKSTELWLGKIEAKLSYKEWYCGHYHICKSFDRHIFMYENVLPICTR